MTKLLIVMWLAVVALAVRQWVADTVWLVRSNRGHEGLQTEADADRFVAEMRGVEGYPIGVRVEHLPYRVAPAPAPLTHNDPGPLASRGRIARFLPPVPPRLARDELTARLSGGLDEGTPIFDALWRETQERHATDLMLRWPTVEVRALFDALVAAVDARADAMAGVTA